MAIKLHNKDCMEALEKMQDNQFDLAIVDPPYGLSITKIWGKKEQGYVEYKKKDWDDNIPNEEYFLELKRVSKNQIIWGGNYFTDFLHPSMGWILWNKMQREFSLADGELAWTSFNKALRVFDMSRGEAISNNKNNGGKFHPTQKPVKLYEWLLMKYAKEGDKILDTHLGSGSIAIACHNLGFDLEGYELDKEYFEAAKQRLKQHQQQMQLFL